MSQRTGSPPTKGSGYEAEGKELRNLGADMLAEVFSYLPHVELFEVMSVSRHWEHATMEGRTLWHEVDVLRKGVSVRTTLKDGMKNEFNEMLSRILRLATKVRFSVAFHNNQKYIQRVGDSLGPQLKVLELPGSCFDAAYLHLLLGNCPQLQSLVIKGEPCNEDAILVRHPELKIFEIRCRKSRPLEVNCPSLTNLSTDGDDKDIRVGLYRPFIVPSIFCPHLSNLRLSPLHCTSAVLDSMAAHSPNIEWLTADCSAESPFNSFTHFCGLRVLKLNDCEGIPPVDDSQWPLLVSLVLQGNRFAKPLEVRHQGLRSLEVIDWEGTTSPTLTCFSLEELKLEGVIIGEQCIHNLNTTCPKLKRLVIEWGMPEGDGPLEIFHEVLEELDVANMCHEHVQIGCQNLKTLVLRWELGEVIEDEAISIPNLSLNCRGVTMLRISGYNDPHCVPWLLSESPNLKALEILNVGTDWRSVLLQHSSLKKLVIGESVMEKLVLAMPSLTCVNIVASVVPLLQVAPREYLRLEATWYRGSDCFKKTILGGEKLTINLRDYYNRPLPLN